MITVRLIGGLGNQMFQYAAGRALAWRLGVPLQLDLGWFDDQPPQDTPRAYELDVFAADELVAKTHVRLPEPRTRLALARVRAGEALGRRARLLRQAGAAFDARALDAPDGTHLIGFWQSERYFSDAADVIRAELVPRRRLSPANAELHASIAASPGSVSVHVRRGDYLSNPNARRFHGVLDEPYYRAALELIAARADIDRAYVFSDDPDWCEHELDLGVPKTVVRGNAGAAVEDMVLMAACRHHVIANSSFSWWGAWLDGRDGVVVAPQRWALDPGGFNPDIYAAGWLRA